MIKAIIKLIKWPQQFLERGKQSIRKAHQLIIILEGMAMNRIYEPGGHLNNKDGLTRYGDSHVKDKTS